MTAAIAGAAAGIGAAIGGRKAASIGALSGGTARWIWRLAGR